MLLRSHDFLIADGFQQNGNETVKNVANLISSHSSTIYLELLSWRSIVDVTGDRRILKKIIRTGEGFDHPNEGSLVKGISLR